ncbi:MAG: hypothetical protein ACR2F2_05930 [Pyrinomonadaceae bacterium]
MKMKIVFMAILTVVLSVAAVSAQDDSVKKMTDFSGKWNLDLSKSKLDERAQNIESMTMTVSQTDTELKIESSTKRAERTDGETRRGGMPNGGGMDGMRRGGGFGGDSQTIYTLDGKETVTDMAGALGGKMTAKATAEKDGKLKLEQTREIETPMGARSMKMTETWSLSADGKTLTVKREAETPRGTNSSEMVFTKQ